MNWLAKKLDSSPNTTLQQQRTKQIESLRKLNPNVQEIQRDVKYLVSFYNAGHKLTLEINLPSQFPRFKPDIKVSPAIHHQWVDSHQMIVGCSSLNQFTMHSNLSRIIEDIVEEFQSHPPILIGSHDNSLQIKENQFGKSQDMANQQYQTSGYDIPVSFTELQNLSLSELQELENDENGLLEMIGKLQCFEVIANERQKTGEENEQLARANLSKKPELENSKLLLLSKMDKINALKQSFDEKSAKYSSMCSSNSMDTTQMNLKVAAVQAEEDSENIAEQFLEGTVSIDIFKQKFLESRSLAHMRRAKDEIFQQIFGQSVHQS